MQETKGNVKVTLLLAASHNLSQQTVAYSALEISLLSSTLFHPCHVYTLDQAEYFLTWAVTGVPITLPAESG